jgi:hypothetical protein
MILGRVDEVLAFPIISSFEMPSAAPMFGGGGYSGALPTFSRIFNWDISFFFCWVCLFISTIRSVLTFAAPPPIDECKKEN